MTWKERLITLAGAVAMFAAFTLASGSESE